MDVDDVDGRAVVEQEGVHRLRRGAVVGERVTAGGVARHVQARTVPDEESQHLQRVTHRACGSESSTSAAHAEGVEPSASTACTSAPPSQSASTASGDGSGPSPLRESRPAAAGPLLAG
ncbi:hypothetical protein [Streptomyces sp. NPDC047985]|uniref:hypothetical protein n=1 Tax=Streptomyces sp. NPDC047985 TaxID=3155384 RepID=UPI003430A7A6